MATDEIGLNAALEREGITAVETDLAELIVQLAGDAHRTSSSPRFTATAPRSQRSSARASRVRPT